MLILPENTRHSGRTQAGSSFSCFFLSSRSARALRRIGRLESAQMTTGAGTISEIFGFECGATAACAGVSAARTQAESRETQFLLFSALERQDFVFHRPRLA